MTDEDLLISDITSHISPFILISLTTILRIGRSSPSGPHDHQQLHLAHIRTSNMFAAQRSGHSAVLSNNTVVLVGGHGKATPGSQQSTMKRLVSPISFSLLNQAPLDNTGDNNSNTNNASSSQAYVNFDLPPQPQLHQNEHLGATQLLSTQSNHGYIHQPMTREHHHMQRVAVPQVPLFIYLYITHTLAHLAATSPDHHHIDPLKPTFSILFAGRQSPTSILDDMWLYCHELDLWLQILPPNSLSMSAIDGGSTVPYSTILCTLPQYTTQTNSVIKYNNILVVNQQIYTVTYTKTSTTRPMFNIEANIPPQLFPTLISTPSHVNIEGIYSDFSTLLGYLTQHTALPTTMTYQTIETSTIPSLLLENTNLMSNDCDPSQWPIARYKATTASINSQIYLHGGRSGYAMNFKKSAHFDHITPISPTFIESNDFVREEAIWPLSSRPVQLYSEDTGSYTNITETEEPYFTSLMLNDLWVLDCDVFPYKWTQIDHSYTIDETNVLPSHRFAHASTILTVDQDNIMLVIFGGLVLKTLSSEVLDVAIGSTVLSSHHQSLVPSSSLFALNISSFTSGTHKLKSSPQPHITSKYYLPTFLPYARSSYNDGTMSFELSMPDTRLLPDRYFDVYGHQLISIPLRNGEFTLLSIGGTSHTCFAAGSVMGLRLNADILLNKQDALYKLEWAPSCQPIPDALFIQHTATLLPQEISENGNRIYKILILGGSALCFSGGSYESISVLFTLETDIKNQFKPYFTPVTLTTAIKSSAPTVKLNKNGKPKQQQNVNKNKAFLVDERGLTRGVQQKCAVCEEEFASKNKLFKHITVTGHNTVTGQKLPTVNTTHQLTDNQAFIVEKQETMTPE